MEEGISVLSFLSFHESQSNAAGAFFGRGGGGIFVFLRALLRGTFEMDFSREGVQGGGFVDDG